MSTVEQTYDVTVLKRHDGEAVMVWESYERVMEQVRDPATRLVELHLIENGDPWAVDPEALELVRQSVRPYHLEGFPKPEGIE